MGKENLSHKLSHVDWYSAGNITLQICKIKIFLYSEWKSLGLALPAIISDSTLEGVHHDLC